MANNNHNSVKQTKAAVDEVPALVSVQALARRWSVGESTVREWARRGTLPSRKVGSKVFFRVSDLAKFGRDDDENDGQHAGAAEVRGR